MNDIHDIVIIGSGNVATVFGRSFKEKGFHLRQVYTPSTASVSDISKELNVDATNDIDQIIQGADLYFIAIKDKAIDGFAEKFSTSSLVVHTSGSASIDKLAPASPRTGVFYPFQTLTKTRKIEMKDIPICLEAKSSDDLNLLKELARKLGCPAYELNHEKRVHLHLTGVIINNFVNYFYLKSKEILDEQHIPFNILEAISEETIKKVFERGPEQSQTGPARRDDDHTIKEHLKLLKDSDFKEIYEIISNNIAKYFRDK